MGDAPKFSIQSDRRISSDISPISGKEVVYSQDILRGPAQKYVFGPLIDSFSRSVFKNDVALQLEIDSWKRETFNEDGQILQGSVGPLKVGAISQVLNSLARKTPELLEAGKQVLGRYAIKSQTVVEDSVELCFKNGRQWRIENSAEVGQFFVELERIGLKKVEMTSKELKLVLDNGKELIATIFER